jgi:hypothetical protein
VKVFKERKKNVNNMTKRAVFIRVIGLIGLAIGIFAMSPYNELGPYHHVIGGGLPFALLLCGFGILFTLLGPRLAPARRIGLQKP